MRIGVRRPTTLTIARTEVASEFDEPGIGVHVHGSSAVGVSALGPSSLEKATRVSDAAGRILAATSNLAAGAQLLDDEVERAQALAGHRGRGSRTAGRG